MMLVLVKRGKHDYISVNKTYLQKKNCNCKKLFTQNFTYYLTCFIFSYGSFMIFFCIHPVVVSESILFFLRWQLHQLHA